MFHLFDADRFRQPGDDIEIQALGQYASRGEYTSVEPTHENELPLALTLGEIAKLLDTVRAAELKVQHDNVRRFMLKALFECHQSPPSRQILPSWRPSPPV
jgi:hypothetical protein